MSDGDDVLADYSTTSGGTTFTRTASYIGGLGIDSKHVKLDGAGSPTYYVPDALGSVGVVIDAAGTVTDARLTNAWGEELRAPQTPDRYGYTSREAMPEISILGGTPAMHYRARTYFPELGRFGQKDPLDSAFEHYIYGFNAPSSSLDPMGTWPDPNPFFGRPRKARFANTISTEKVIGVLALGAISVADPEGSDAAGGMIRQKFVGLVESTRSIARRVGPINNRDPGQLEAMFKAHLDHSTGVEFFQKLKAMIENPSAANRGSFYVIAGEHTLEVAPLLKGFQLASLPRAGVTTPTVERILYRGVALTEQQAGAIEIAGLGSAKTAGILPLWQPAGSESIASRLLQFLTGKPFPKGTEFQSLTTSLTRAEEMAVGSSVAKEGTLAYVVEVMVVERQVVNVPAFLEKMGAASPYPTVGEYVWLGNIPARNVVSVRAVVTVVPAKR